MTEHTALEPLIDQWAKAWSTADIDNLLALFTEDIVYEDVTFGAVNKGKQAVRDFAAFAWDAIPGMTFEIKSRSISNTGTAGACEWIWRGKQTKDIPGLKATNTPFQIRGVSIIEFREGKISRCSDYWDLVTYMKQVGLIK